MPYNSVSLHPHRQPRQFLHHWPWPLGVLSILGQPCPHVGTPAFHQANSFACIVLVQHPHLQNALPCQTQYHTHRAASPCALSSVHPRRLRLSTHDPCPCHHRIPSSFHAAHSSPSATTASPRPNPLRKLIPFGLRQSLPHDRLHSLPRICSFVFSIIITYASGPAPEPARTAQPH
jgi:hypothetical protein